MLKLNDERLIMNSFKEDMQNIVNPIKKILSLPIVVIKMVRDLVFFTVAGWILRYILNHMDDISSEEESK